MEMVCRSCCAPEGVCFYILYPGEFVRPAELPCLTDLLFVRNPLEEKHSAKGTWMDEATKRLPNLKKLDGTLVIKLEVDEGEGES